MYLKSVEIIGFKSFAEKTRIDLKPGITAIVGPNGSGKSNVAECIRWCIGEMSWKSLRSDAMVDVIFAGTQRRSPLNLAEVNLIFDNASSLLPVQYSEVTVTRRIYRSGESEYYLNKTQCRLRDIRELFLDTGIGGEGYAIIDQGGVDFVLSSKPEDRRALFEEAAGVSKYRAKREEALRKLEKVDQDMARLSDAIALINEQIKKLDNDARKARLFQKYRGELTAMEAKGLVQEILALRSERSAHEAEAEPVRRQAGDVRVAVEALEAEVATLSLERAGREDEVLRFNQGLSAVKAEIGRLEERVQQARASAEDLSARRRTLAAEIESDRQRGAAMEPELERLAAELKRQEEFRAEVERDYESSRQAVLKAEGELEKLKARSAEIEAERLRLAQLRQDLSRDLARAESELQHEQVDLKGALKDLEKQAARLEAGTAERTALAAERERLAGEAEDQKASVVDLETRQKAAVQRISELDQSVWELKGRRGEREARLAALESQALQDPHWAGAQAVLSAQIPGVLGRLRQFVEVDLNYRTMIEEALGDALDAVVVEDLEAARQGVEFLKTTGKGRSRFLILASAPRPPAGPAELPFGARALLSALRADPKVERVLEGLLHDVYLQGRVVYGPHWIAGGSEEIPPSPVSEREDLRREIDALQAQREKAESEKASAQADLAAIEATLAEARPALKEAETRVLEVQAREREREAFAASLREEVQSIERQAVKLLAEISERLEARVALHARSGEAARREEAGQAEFQAAVQAREALQSDVHRENGRFVGLKTQRDHAAQQVSFLASQYERLQKERESLKAVVERRAEELALSQKRAEELAEQEKEARARLLSLYAEQAAKEEEARTLFAALEDLRRRSDEKSASASAKKTELEGLMESLHRLEMQIGQVQAREDVAVSRLRDEHQLAPEEAQQRHAEVESTPETLESLRSRIQRLGNVNMAAPEEYEALNSRHGFLAGQLEDLNKAKADLQSAIQKINATTRENFRQTFQDVREHFRRIYGSLFEGGEADLLLTDPENLLETGVEVFAQPPGKKLQSITLLSGGEKTLTAISLLFAFFSVKRSPFCIMDEADAALDEANVERFVQLIKTFAQDSQFIVISHNKRTMEAANVLYGVTMEESGVSQIISMELRKAVARAEERPLRPAGESETTPAAV